MGVSTSVAISRAKHDGVFAIWYGKGPDIDRLDAFKHGNRMGSSSRDGVAAFRILRMTGDEELAPYSAHIDSFARDNLPSRNQWPELVFELPSLQYPEMLNCATLLLDSAVNEGHAERIAIYCETGNLTYAQLLILSNRIANVLVKEQDVLPGNRVLLRGANSPMLCAVWLAVMKIGAIAVTTMPMLRAKELGQIASKACIKHGVSDARFLSDLSAAAGETGFLSKLLTWGDGALEAAIARHSPDFANIATSACDVCLIAFTSGTTGGPKATMHFHRDVLAMCDTVGRYLLETSVNDIYVGSPPLGFTFGLGALLAFPLRFRAAAVMVEQPNARALLAAVQRFRATCLFTAPTMYKTLLTLVDEYDIKSLRQSVSAGEALPKTTSDAWHAVTGIRLIDGIGSTEMIHIFISAKGDAIRPGATGKPVPGYQAVLLDDQGDVLLSTGLGRLAVRGPTGCRYLADPRQTEYVVNGWNITGDRYRRDADGYYWFESRIDDMIISSGYNIAGPEVESAIIAHPAVKEVAVIGVPNEQRGQIVTAFVVLETGYEASPALARALQDFAKGQAAPYKYPRTVIFVQSLPKGPSGKVLRFVLREQEASGVHPASSLPFNANCAP